MKTAEKPRAEPKTGRKPKPAPRAAKTWTPEEDAFLQDKWGTLSIPIIAKQLGRSVGAINNRRYHLGCGAHLENDHRVNHCRFQVVDLEEFWKWAEDHKDIMDFSRFEEYSLGKEPAWVKVKRRADFEKLQSQGAHNEVWATTIDQKLKRMLSQHKYTYRDLSKELSRSEGAIKRRILDLGLKERPVRNKTRMWTEEEVETLCEMAEKGYDWEQIAEKLDRSALATRGKYERLMNPAYMKRYYRGNGTEYQDIYSMKPSEVLARHKVMQGVEFTEAPPMTQL